MMIAAAHDISTIENEALSFPQSLLGSSRRRTDGIVLCWELELGQERERGQSVDRLDGSSLDLSIDPMGGHVCEALESEGRRGKNDCQGEGCQMSTSGRLDGF